MKMEVDNEWQEVQDLIENLKQDGMNEKGHDNSSDSADCK